MLFSSLRKNSIILENFRHFREVKFSRDFPLEGKGKFSRNVFLPEIEGNFFLEIFPQLSDLVLCFPALLFADFAFIYPKSTMLF